MTASPAARLRPTVEGRSGAPVLGHHGRPVTPPDGYIEKEVFGDGCRRAAQGLIDVAKRLFEPKPVLAPDATALARASWRIAGMGVLVDWLGSNERWFPYAAPTLSAEGYYQTFARPRARTAWQEAGLMSARPAPAMGFRTLTGIGEPPSPVQV